jgi:hypothetical protein
MPHQRTTFKVTVGAVLGFILVTVAKPSVVPEREK